MTCPCLRARHHERREKDGGFKGGGDKHTDTHRRALALNNFPLADRVRAAWAATGRGATRRDRPSPCRSQFCFVFGAFITHTRKKRHKRRQSHARHPMAATHAAPYSPHQQHDDFFGFFCLRHKRKRNHSPSSPIGTKRARARATTKKARPKAKFCLVLAEAPPYLGSERQREGWGESRLTHALINFHGLLSVVVFSLGCHGARQDRSDERADRKSVV